MLNIFYIILLSVNTFFIPGYHSGNGNNNNNVIKTGTKDTVATARFSAVGDLMLHSTQYNYARVAPDSFDFNGVFGVVKEVFDSSDFVMGNLETTFAGREEGYGGYPVFNSPDDFLYAIDSAGFDHLFLANNHTIDKGEKGAVRTMGLLDSLGISFSGGARSFGERDSVKLYDVNGIKTTVLAYTYGSNGNNIEPGKEYLLNYIDSLKIKDDINRADTSGAELIIVYMHYGLEYKQEPNIYQKDITERVIGYGADIILASHPHCMQPVIYYKSPASRIDSGMVVYSMGNFISNQRWRYSDAGVIVNFNIEKNLNSGKISLKESGILPTWVFKGSTEKGREYIILPAETAFNDSLPYYLTDKDVKLMEESYFDTKRIMSKYFPQLKVYTERDTLQLTDKQVTPLN